MEVTSQVTFVTMEPNATLLNVLACFVHLFSLFLLAFAPFSNSALSDYLTTLIYPAHQVITLSFPIRLPSRSPSPLTIAIVVDIINIIRERNISQKQKSST